MHTTTLSHYYNFTLSIINLEPDENMRLLRHYRISGNISYRNQLILKNYKLILKEVHRYANGNEETFQDILASAVLGFIDGVEKFDLRKSVINGRRMKLTSYCVIRMRKAICEYFEEYGRMIRLPWRPLREAKALSKRMQRLEEFETPVDVLMEGKSNVLRHGVMDILYGQVYLIAKQEDDEERCPLKISTDSRQDIDIVAVVKKCPAITNKERKALLAHFGIEGKRIAGKPAEIQKITAKVKAWAIENL